MALMMFLCGIAVSSSDKAFAATSGTEKKKELT
jgi:hypothetical protein